jgi:D-arabinose 1-dehydrogenase-like Zn-dependent alcohol dehydrogenase
VKVHYKLRGMDSLTDVSTKHSLSKFINTDIAKIFNEMEEGMISGRAVIDLR